MSSPQDAKGPAATGIAPDHGSTNPNKEKLMNVQGHSTSPVNVSRKSYSMDDAQLDAIHSHELLDTIVALVAEMPFVRDGKRDREMHRLMALVWIARDHVEAIAENIEVCIIQTRLDARAAQ